MHLNIALQTAFYNASDTNDSTKQDLPNQSENPFALSLSTNAHQMIRPSSLRSLWNNTQKEKFTIFSCYFREVLANLKPESMNWNVFKGMARFIKTRNPQQCRSHHLKLTKEFNGVGQFLSQSFKRIRRLQEKMHQVQKVLTQIQEEFQLFYKGPHQDTEQKENLFAEIQLANSNDLGVQNGVVQEKIDKQKLKKTAASYEEGQNPVKNNIIFGSLSSSKSFPNIKVKGSRSSLPSFDNEEKLTENGQISNELIKESPKQPSKQLKSSYGKDWTEMHSQMNFDTFRVPDHIRTTQQMYRLWENSGNRFGKQGESEKV